jgi:hypothetical protein
VPAAGEGLTVPIHDPEMDSVSPQQVFAILSGDVDRCFRLLDAALGGPEEAGEQQYGESDVRSYVRAAFACMEGMTFCMRAWAAERGVQTRADQRQAAAEEGALELWVDLESSVKSMFAQLDQVKRIEPQMGTGRQWWTNFQNAIQLRRRMMYPQLPADLALSREELLTIVDADAGFRLLLSRYLEA